MAKPKENRNIEFIKAWKEEGLSNKELQEKFDLSPGGVKGLKARLRKRDPSLYTGRQEKIDRKAKKKQINTSPSPQVAKVISQQINKRMTVYLKPELIKDIKHLATDRDSNISELVGKIIEQYLESTKGKLKENS
ncbi:hypothetical protein ES702_07016 [subsurface metagenome]